MKNLNQIDLNLLVYLEVLLRERNVTQAANQLGLSQPAMSNGLRRLRALFDDPLLVRTSEGMTPTERALELEPLVKEILLGVDRAMQPATEFAPGEAQMVVRIMASDYAESTLFPAVLTQLREHAPGITLDIMNPSDVSFLDVERGKVDLVINRFDQMPQSFHQITLWEDSFSCLMSADNPILEDFLAEKLPQRRSHLGQQNRYGGRRGGGSLVTCSDWAGSMPRSQSRARSDRYASLPATTKPP
jgi:DNA-binding transcriptional LysR family regulator